MNAERLLALYDRVADAPGAVPRLRRFILDLAVRGRLVEQDPADEPASELLKRIAAEKARIAVAGKFKILGVDLPRDDASFPFSIPANWMWCYLDDLAAVARGGSPRPIKSFLTEDPTGMPWIKIGDSTRGSIYISDTKEKIKLEGISKSRVVFPGDLLLSNSMSFGFPYITNIKGCIHDGWLVIRTPETTIDKLYLHTVFLSGHAKAVFLKMASGAVVQNLNADKARLLSVPLPPLAEQHRIVAKVDELMALCDRLEAARAAREERRDRLTAAGLARLNAPDPDAATFRAHARFAVDKLPALTARADQVARLRRTILNLAVRGKLVEQDPADEPASELLKRIAADRVKNTDRQYTTLEIDESKLGAIPEGWSAVLLIQLGCWALGSGFPKNEQGATDGPYFFLKVSDMNLPGNEKIIVSANNHIDEAACKRIKARIHSPGTIIFPKIGGAISTNKRRILGKPSAIDNNCLGITFSRYISLEWAYLILCSLDFTQYQVGSTVPALQQGKLGAIPILLPPFAEQHRIVAKVDELMALCDRLEAGLAAADTARRRLLDSLLHETLDEAA